MSEPFQFADPQADSIAEVKKTVAASNTRMITYSREQILRAGRHLYAPVIHRGEKKQSKQVVWFHRFGVKITHRFRDLRQACLSFFR